MTKEQARALMVDRTLAGKPPYKSYFEEAIFKAGVCQVCKHTMDKITKVYISNPDSRYSDQRDGKSLSCQCGVCTALWAKERLWFKCKRCQTLPLPVTKKIPPAKDASGSPIGEGFSFLTFVCPCGMVETTKNDLRTNIRCAKT